MVAVLLTLLVLLQFPADFGSVAYATQKNEIRGTISVASNISHQDMQQYLDGFNKKYPGIEVKYQSYSDYDNEVSKQIQGGDYPDVLFVPGSVPGAFTTGKNCRFCLQSWILITLSLSMIRLDTPQEMRRKNFYRIRCVWCLEHMSLWRGLAEMSLYSVYKTVIRRVFRHSWINWSEACVRHLHMAGVQCRCPSVWVLCI